MGAKKKLKVYMLLGSAILLVVVLFLCRSYIEDSFFLDEVGLYVKYERIYSKIVEKDGAVSALEMVKRRYLFDPLAKKYCHQIVHIIGRASAVKYAGIGEAFSSGDPFCWSGYYHGVVEGFFLKSEMPRLNETAQEICGELKRGSPYSFDHYNCVHGIGHGLMYISDNNLPSSLHICERFKDGWERESCYGGVFMENLISHTAYHSTTYLNKSDPFYPCDAIAKEYRYSCYLMQTSWMLEIAQGDFNKVFSWCREIDSDLKNTCFQSIGRDASGGNYGEPRSVKRLCLLGNEGNEQVYCVIGAAADMVSNFHSRKEAMEFCDLLEGSLRETCVSATERYGGSFG